MRRASKTDKLLNPPPVQNNSQQQTIQKQQKRPSNGFELAQSSMPETSIHMSADLITCI